MTTRTLVFTLCLITTAAAHAQPPQAPAAPRAAAQARVPPAPPAPPAPGAPSAPAAPQAPRAPRALAPPTPHREGQPINVRVDFNITDTRPGVAPIKKTISVISADGFTGSIRSQGDYVGIGSVPLNVDAAPELLPDGKVRVRFNIQYDLPTPAETLAANVGRTGTATKTGIHQSVVIILENGQSLVAAQSADPVNDRQVTVEVKATILK